MGFEKINANAYFLPGPCNIGLLVRDGRGILIDAGIDKSSTKKITKGLAELAVTPVALITTHAHADHYGGNLFLQKDFPDLKIYASAVEKSIIEEPEYEGFYLCGGATAPQEMDNKFYHAEKANVDEVLTPGPLKIAGLSLEIIALPGHTPGQIGVKYDEVLFTADAFFGKKIVDKYGAPYFADIKSTLETLALLDKTEALLIPAHGEVDLTKQEDVATNLLTIRNTISFFLQLLLQPRSLEGLVKAFTDYYQLSLASLGQYLLTRATVTAYLHYLLNSNQIGYYCKGNLLYWEMK